MRRLSSRPKGIKRVLVVDPDNLAREAVPVILARETADLRVCAAVEDDVGMWAAMRRRKPRIIILDLNLKKIDGMQLLAVLRAKHPHIPVLILSGRDEQLYARKAFQAGARGYLMKDHCADKLVPAIRTVLAGKRYASEEVKEKALGEISRLRGGPDDLITDGLTDRQRHVLELLGHGYGPTDIANRLQRGVKTVEYHCVAMIKKLRLLDMRQLRALAVKRIENTR